MADSERSSDQGSDQPTGLGGAMLLKEQPVALDTGSVLDGRYQIRRIVGKGATGVVLEADDRVSRSVVAIKVFKPEIATDARWEEIVGSELRHARKLQHPNVCRVFDASAGDGYRYLTLEYASGGSLRARLTEVGAARPIEERIADARAVVDGLAAIHAAGIIHRDMKPDNVLRMEDGRLVVTDFGLAVAPGQTTFHSGYSGAVGTPSYMAPEVAMGGDASPASDVYSLGVILHEIMFGGRPEWDVTKRGRYLKSPLHKGSTRIERSMARLCAECLQELAPRRPQNAGEVQARFAKAVVGRYGSFVGAMRAGKWGIAVGVLLALLAASFTWRATRPRDSTVSASVVGEPRDWTDKARLVVSRPEPLLCLDIDTDGKTVRMVSGRPPASEEVDLRTGAARPWNVVPETYANGACPRLSPDGRSILFDRRGRDGSSVFISRRPDGREAELIAAGAAPMWMPSGLEFLFILDRQRVAHVVPQVAITPLPATPVPGMEVSTQAINHAGREVAVGHSDDESTVVTRLSLPGFHVLNRTKMPGRALATRYGADGTLRAVLLEKGRTYVARIQRDGRVIPVMKLRGLHIHTLLQAGPADVVGTVRRESHLVRSQRDGSEVRVASAARLEGLTEDSAGNALVAQTSADGTRSVLFVAAAENRPRVVARGQTYGEPAFLPGGRDFLLVDSRQGHLLRCSLRGAECEPLRSIPSDARQLAVSPSGNRVAFTSGRGRDARVWIVDLDGDPPRDLAPALSPCRPKWVADERLLILRVGGNSGGWIEVDLLTGKPTGRTENWTPKAGPFSCPPESERSDWTLRTEAEYALWEIPPT